MKASESTQAQIREAVAPLDTPETRAGYVRRGLSDKRYRWDLLWATMSAGEIGAFYRDGLNDDHIDTVLRSCVAPLEREAA